MRDKEQHDMQIRKRSKDGPRAIQYNHQTKHLVMGLHINHLTNIAKKQQSKNHISKGKGKIRWRWHLLESDERNAKINDRKVHKMLEDAAANGIPVSLGNGFCDFEENGVKSYFTPPFIFVSAAPTRPSELILLFFKKDFAKFFCYYYYYIYFPSKPYNYV